MERTVALGVMLTALSSTRYFPELSTRALNGKRWRPPSGTTISDLAFPKSFVKPSNCVKSSLPRFACFQTSSSMTCLGGSSYRATREELTASA